MRVPFAKMFCGSTLCFTARSICIPVLEMVCSSQRLRIFPTGRTETIVDRARNGEVVEYHFQRASRTFGEISLVADLLQISFTTLIWTSKLLVAQIASHEYFVLQSC
uniref:Putative secreted protein n=1 Tax=Ixodes ricinus TaxID=34613 RepID=A0A6B0U9I6_IXORI